MKALKVFAIILIATFGYEAESAKVVYHLNLKQKGPLGNQRAFLIKFYRNITAYA